VIGFSQYLVQILIQVCYIVSRGLKWQISAKRKSTKRKTVYTMAVVIGLRSLFTSPLVLVLTKIVERNESVQETLKNVLQSKTTANNN